MGFIYEPPTNLILAALFLLVAVGSAWRGTRLIFKGLRQVDHPSGSLWVVGGIRGWIVALAMGALAGGVLFANRGLVMFGAIFLGEELYETGFMILALRAGQKVLRSESSLG